MVNGRIEKVSKGKYRLIAVLGYKRNGSAIRKTKIVQASSDRQAYLQLDDFLNLFENADDTPIDYFNMTFGDFYNQIWLKEAPINIEPKTFHNYKRTIENRFYEKFEMVPLSSIKPYMIKKIIVNAERMSGAENPKPLTRNSRMRMLASINNLFLMVVNEYKILKENPCEQVKIPRQPQDKKNVRAPYSEDEINQLLAALSKEDITIRALILVALVTGARESEIAALEEKDIDFENGSIIFHQRISEVDNKTDIRLMPGLKNQDDEKVVRVPEALLATIKELIRYNTQIRWKLRVKKLDHYFLFESVQDGRLPRGSYLYKKFKRFVKRHGLRPIRFHDLRHTSATILLSDPNMTPKELQERLGHRDYNTTVNTYGHVLKKQKDTATEIFSTMLESN